MIVLETIAAVLGVAVIEAGVSDLWYRWVGLDGKVVGIDRFGISAPGSTVMKELGMTAENVVKAARELA